MSTAPASAALPRPAVPRLDEPVQPVTIGRVVRSEWVKFRTLRSTWSVLAGAVVGLVVIAAIIAYNTRDPAGLAPEDSAPSATLQGYYLGQLLIASLGVLVVSGEYSTGMIRSTFAAVPRRLPVLVGKIVVFTTVVLTAMVVAAFAAFLVAQAVTSRYRTAYSLSTPGALRVVLGTAGYLTMVGLIGAALGWIVRSTPGALVGVAALVLVLPVVFGNLFGSWGRSVAAYLPAGAGASFATSVPDPGSLHPWPGFLVLLAWVVGSSVLAAVLLRRRDA